LYASQPANGDWRLRIGSGVPAAKPALGALAKVVSKPKFVGGELVACTIVKDANALAGNRLWSTVQRLDAGEYTRAEYAKVYRHRVMGALRVVRVDAADDLVELCTGKTVRPFEELVVDWFTTREQADALAHATALPKLRALELRCTVPEPEARATARVMMQTVAAAKLERLRITLPAFETDIGAIVAVAVASRLELVDRTQLATEYVFERDPAGAFSRLAVSIATKATAGWTEAILDALEAALGSLQAPLTELALVPKPPPAKPVNKKRLAAIATRFAPRR
jgi:hypothetical protein